MQHQNRADECQEHFRQILLEANKVHELSRRLKVTIIRVAAVELRPIVAENQRGETVERLLDVSRLEDPMENLRHVLYENEASAEENVSRH